MVDGGGGGYVEDMADLRGGVVECVIKPNYCQFALAVVYFDICGVGNFSAEAGQVADGITVATPAREYAGVGCCCKGYNQENAEC